MTRFLQRYLARFVEFFNIRLVAPAHKTLRGEVVTRFVVSSGHYRKTEKKVKSAAFMPEIHPDTGVLETSVFRIMSFADGDVWQLGRDQISKDRKIHCRADLNVDEVVALSPLRIIEEPSTHERHATIVMWPAEKDAQKLLALELERLAVTVPSP